MNIRYGKTLSIPRKVVKYLLCYIVYPLVVKLIPLPKVKSIDETLDKLLTERCSISRFGDGEFLYLIDRLDLPFQRYEPELAEKFKAILKSKDKRVLIGLPSGYYDINGLVKKSIISWRSQVAWVYPRLKPYLLKEKTYYNASFTRFYYEVLDKDQSCRYIDKIKKLWANREVLLIEGEMSRLGVGNDLFEAAKEVKRIIAPAHHAFGAYRPILNKVSSLEKVDLILLALGPTATAMAYDLTILGYQAIDIGNVDIEYEWFLSGTNERIRIPGKYTSEVKGGREVEDLIDESYQNQIIARFN